MRRILAPLAPALAGLLLATTAGFAQTPPAPAPAPAPAAAAPAAAAISPEAHALATELTKMIGVDRQAQQLVAIMRGQMVQTVMRSGGKSAEDSAKIVDEVMMPDFIAQLPELNGLIIDAWASNFSVEDLKGLRAFYATPLGQKLISTLPAVTQQGMAASQGWGQRIYQASIQKHKAQLEGLGLKF